MATATVTGVTRFVRMIAALCALGCGGCSIERSRQAGDDCLQDRECAAGLRCEITASGAQRCVAPVRVDASFPPVMDAGPTVTDTGARDAPKPPPDVATDRGVSAQDVPADAARDVPRDAPEGSDVSADGEAVEDAATTSDGP